MVDQNAQKTAIFACYADHLDGGHGGVQVCTHEYLQTIETAGLLCRVVRLDPNLSLTVRIKRKLLASPFAIQPTAENIGTLLEMVRTENPDFVFLNQVSLATLAEPIRRAARSPLCIVLLSHGLESTDMLHLARLRKKLPLSGSLVPSAAWCIGDTILAEAQMRAHVDLVIALSPFDVALEGWMGARRAEWMPRTIVDAALDWSPVMGRLGYLGTLDHAPNLEGLTSVLDLLGDNDPFEVRIVGGPASLGNYLQERYRNVAYLGVLDEGALREEAASWQAFLHPIFCDARGCSTKLATALGWKLPIITTRRGARGYAWLDGSLSFGDEPSDFADQCRALNMEVARALRDEVVKVAASSPTLAKNAALLRQLLHLIPAQMS